MNLFYKNKYLDLKSEYLELKKEEKEMIRKQEETIKAKDDFSYTLLIEKHKLENMNEKLSTKLSFLESEKIKTTVEYEEVIEKLNLENSKLKKENIELKFEKKRLSSSIGGYQTKNNKLIQENGNQQCYINLLIHQLRKYGRKTPTLNELLTYERTKKSPYKKDVEIINIVEKEKKENENN